MLRLLGALFWNLKKKTPPSLICTDLSSINLFLLSFLGQSQDLLLIFFLFLKTKTYNLLRRGRPAILHKIVVHIFEITKRPYRYQVSKVLFLILICFINENYCKKFLNK